MDDNFPFLIALKSLKSKDLSILVLNKRRENNCQYIIIGFLTGLILVDPKLKILHAASKTNELPNMHVKKKLLRYYMGMGMGMGMGYIHN